MKVYFLIVCTLTFLADKLSFIKALTLLKLLGNVSVIVLINPLYLHTSWCGCNASPTNNNPEFSIIQATPY